MRKENAMSVTDEIPPGSPKTVKSTMQQQALVVRVGAFFAAAGLAFAIAYAMGQTLLTAAALAAVAGIFAFGAAVFSSGINTQATMAKRKDRAFRTKSTND
jgi:fatty acid desaturase